MALYYVPQFKSTQLSGAIDNSQTSSITLLNVDGVDTAKPGVICVTYATPLDTSTAEFITYTSINGSKELVGASRAAEGISAKAHLDEAQVGFIISKSHINNLNDALSIGGSATTVVTGTLDEDDMATDSAVKLATQQSIKKYVDDNVSSDGWTSVSDTWTYASATTITVPSGATATYEKGDKIRLKQGGNYKYWYLAVVASTLLTLIPTDDYTLANDTITDVGFSKVLTPIDFPVRFQFTPTWTGFSTDPTQVLDYWVVGNHMHVLIECAAASNSTTFNLTVPVAKSAAGYSYYNVQVIDNGSWQNNPGIVGLTNNVTLKVGITISTQSGNTFGGFTASGNKGFNGYFVYPF